MRFRFETLLRLRKNQENLVQRDLGTINAHLVRQQDRLGGLEEKSQYYREVYNHNVGQITDIGTLTAYDRYFESNKTDSAHQRRIIAEVEKRADSKRQDLAEAMKKRRTLEILRERQFEAVKKEQRRQETAFFDEIAGTHRKGNRP